MTNRTSIRLRRAQLEDCRLIFEWRNLPEVVARGSSQSAIAWEDHQQWFARVHRNERHLLWLILEDENPVGQIRFDRLDEASARVSIYLHPNFTGRGLGILALQTGSTAAFRSWPEVRQIEALIRNDNQPSIRAFAKAGYEVSSASTDAEHTRMRRPRPSRVPHNRLTVDERDVAAVATVVRSGHWTGGPQVSALERACADRIGVAHGVALGSGFAALRLGLHALGIGPGDKVLIPAYSCVALANSVLALGAQPWAVEVRDDLTIDPAACRNALGAAKPKAIIAVHTFGAQAAIPALLELGVPVVEDCAHAFGKVGDGIQFGGIGTATILSFHATKLLGAGEGGLLLTREPALAARVRESRDCADLPPTAIRMNDRLSELEAALALSQFSRLPEFIASRQRLAQRYSRLLADEAGLCLPESCNRIWYRFAVSAIQCPPELLIERMSRNGVAVDRPWPEWRNISDRFDQTPVADAAYRNLISLPIYPTLTDAEQDRVVEELRAAVRASEDGR